MSPLLIDPHNPSSSRTLLPLPWHLALIQAAPASLPLISSLSTVLLPLLHSSYSLLLASTSLLAFFSEGFLALGTPVWADTTQERTSSYDVQSEIYDTRPAHDLLLQIPVTYSSCCKTEGCLMTIKYRVELHLLIERSSFNYLKAGCIRNDETPHKSTVPTEVSNKLLGKWIWRTTISNQAAISLLMQIP